MYHDSKMFQYHVKYAIGAQNNHLILSANNIFPVSESDTEQQTIIIIVQWL